MGVRERWRDRRRGGRDSKREGAGEREKGARAAAAGKAQERHAQQQQRVRLNAPPDDTCCLYHGDPSRYSGRHLVSVAGGCT